MKTQKIRIRNLNDTAVRQGFTVHVKPVPQLTTMLCIGAIMIIANPNLILAGMGLVCISVFGIAVFPDRSLITFLDDYMVLYNQQDRSMCMIVYYDEVVQWQYVYHKNYDQLVITLVDGSTETQEMYSQHSVSQQLNTHLAGKKRKSSRMRRENA
ncbi:MAG: hypothetical protein ACI32N_09495 [Bulleidia sp.]